MGKDDLNNNRYLSSSPDEHAFVVGAKNYGFTFTDRDHSSILINIFGVEEKFKILATFPYTNERKMSSIIISINNTAFETREYSAILLLKGADSEVFKRVKNYNEPITYEK